MEYNKTWRFQQIWVNLDSFCVTGGGGGGSKTQWNSVTSFMNCPLIVFPMGHSFLEKLSIKQIEISKFIVMKLFLPLIFLIFHFIGNIFLNFTEIIKFFAEHSITSRYYLGHIISFQLHFLLYFMSAILPVAFYLKQFFVHST